MSLYEIVGLNILIISNQGDFQITNARHKCYVMSLSKLIDDEVWETRSRHIGLDPRPDLIWSFMIGEV